MTKQPSAEEYLPERITLTNLRTAAAACQGCDLYKRATQTVFGEGPRTAAIMLVGEVPGDQEDKAGKPFVGPAGRLLDQALHEIGLDRKDVYVTNAVKHFSWEAKGKRRMHQKPRWREVQACRPWLAAEIRAVSPQVIVCLGATAAQALMGASFRITKVRGQFLESEWAPFLMATYHPSAILRAPKAEDRQRMRAELIEALRRVMQKERSSAID